MRLKSFYAKSMPEAMRQVRASLGGEAVIVTSREEASGWVRITAAVEQLNAAPEPEEVRDGFDADEVAEIITDILLKHRVPASVSSKIISVSMTLFGNDPRKMFAEALQKTFSFDPSYAGKKRKPLVPVGPPGAGKTLTAAKMAACAVMDGQKPAIITTDIARAGGVEQLSAFLNILSLPLLQAEDARGLKSALAKAGNSSQIIIDTGGLNPFDPQEMKALAKLMSVEEMEPALVLPAGMDAEESAEIAMTFSVLGVKRLIPTRLDFARRFGGILSAADRAGLSFTEGSHTPQVANGILTMTPETLANLLMPHSPKRDKVKS